MAQSCSSSPGMPWKITRGGILGLIAHHKHLRKTGIHSKKQVLPVYQQWSVLNIQNGPLPLFTCCTLFNISISWLGVCMQKSTYATTFHFFALVLQLFDRTGSSWVRDDSMSDATHRTSTRKYNLIFLLEDMSIHAYSFFLTAEWNKTFFSDKIWRAKLGKVQMRCCWGETRRFRMLQSFGEKVMLYLSPPKALCLEMKESLCVCEPEKQESKCRLDWLLLVSMETPVGKSM